MADRDEDDKDDESSEPPQSKARSKRDRDDVDDVEEAPRPKKKSLAKNTRKTASSDKPKQKPNPREKDAPKKPEPSSSSNLVWVGLLALIALGAWWMLRGPSSGTQEEPPTARSEMPSAPSPAPTPKPEQPAGGAEEPTPAPAAESEEPSTSAAPAPSAAPPSAAGGGSFDRAVALEALAKSGAKAAGCRMRGEPAGTANVTVTFEPSGKVKDAEIRSGAFSGSPTGKCIIKKLMETTIAPFSGDPGQVIAPVSVR